MSSNGNTKVCTVCKLPWPATTKYFYRKKDSLQPRCKSCESDRDRARQANRRQSEDKKFRLRVRSKALGYLAELHPDDYADCERRAEFDLRLADALKAQREELIAAFRAGRL